MTRSVHWSRAARADVKAIVRHVSIYDYRAAVSLRKQIDDAALYVAQASVRFKEGRLPGTQELVVTRNYILVFRALPDRIDVVNVVHTRQQYP
jgi:plasmid stabilization system protein ParE